MNVSIIDWHCVNIIFSYWSVAVAEHVETCFLLQVDSWDCGSEFLPSHSVKYVDFSSSAASGCVNATEAEEKKEIHLQSQNSVFLRSLAHCCARVVRVQGNGWGSTLQVCVLLLQHENPVSWSQGRRVRF